MTASPQHNEAKGGCMREREV